MRCEVLAIGTELLLGQVVDTNSGVIGELLAANGIDSLLATKVGDNFDRAVQALRGALDRADAVIVCGGLGPTHDDITRSVLAAVAGVSLERDEAVADVIRAMFARRNRLMPENNLLQADVPVGAVVIPQTLGTAPGLICPLQWPDVNGTATTKVVYAIPGVPYEMRDMMERAVIPDLITRQGEHAVIASRTLRTWGESESGLAERLEPVISDLERVGAGVGDDGTGVEGSLIGPAAATIAFLASGIEGIKVRVTAKAPTRDEALRRVEPVVTRIRAEIGDQVFAEDDETMEAVVLAMIEAQGQSLAVAESMTGGMVAARLTAVPGASRVFRGGVVSYASEVKFDVLGVVPGPVVCDSAAQQMADGVRRVLGASVGLSITGVAGPAEQDGQPPGTVFVGWAVGDVVSSVKLGLFGDRERVRAYATISALDVLRRTLRDATK